MFEAVGRGVFRRRWAVIAAALAVILIKTGVIARIPW